MVICLRIFSNVFKFGVMFEWQIQRSVNDSCRTRTRSLVFDRNPRFAASSVIRKRASFPLFDAQKNDVWLLRSGAIGLVRPTCAAGARSVLWRHAHLSGNRSAAGTVSRLWAGEARATGVSGGQPVLNQALCPLRGLTASASNDQGRRPGVQPGLDYGQRWTCNTCVRSLPKRGRQDPRPSVSTRYRSRRVTPMVSCRAI